MKNLEQPIMKNFDKSEGGESAKVFVDGNKNTTTESARTTENFNQEIISNGSENLGKFKDVESLMKAYNSLQSEFTKKSQRLSELENEIKPLAKSDKVNAILEEVFSKYSVNGDFKEKLKETLIKEDSENLERTAEQNLLKLLAENYKSPESLVCNEQFLSDFVFNNAHIKETIIKEYLDKLQSVPNIKVSTNFNSSIPATPPNVVKTIDEAGNIAKSMIKKI